MTIDETLEQLNQIIRTMEQGDETLEEALSNFESGIKLIKSCNRQLDRVEKKIKILSESGEPSDDERNNGGEGC